MTDSRGGGTTHTLTPFVEWFARHCRQVALSVFLRTGAREKKGWGLGGAGGASKNKCNVAESWLGRVPGGAASLWLTQACAVYDFQRLLQVTQRDSQSSPWPSASWALDTVLPQTMKLPPCSGKKTKNKLSINCWLYVDYIWPPPPPRQSFFFFLIKPVYLLHNINIRPPGEVQSEGVGSSCRASPLLSSSLSVWRLPVEH